MIFITLGSQKFQFNRLLKKVDELVERNVITEKVFAQTGASDYIPRNYEYQPFLSRDDFSNIILQCDVVITHGGTGAIIGAIKNSKKVVAVPRLSKYGEHVDDHQLQLIKQFNEMKLICPCENIDELEKALTFVRKNDFNSYCSNTHAIINSIDDFLLMNF